MLALRNARSAWLVVAFVGFVAAGALAPTTTHAEAPARPASLAGRIDPVFPLERGAAIVLAEAESAWAEGEPRSIAAYGLFVAARAVSDRVPAERRAALGREARVFVGTTEVTTTVRELAILSVVGSLDSSPTAAGDDDGSIARRTVRLAETSWLVAFTDVVGEDAGFATFDAALVPHVVPVTAATAATRRRVVRAMLDDEAFVDDAMAFETSLRRDDSLSLPALRAELQGALVLSELDARGRHFLLASYAWEDDCGGGTTTLLLERTRRGIARIDRILPFAALLDFGADTELLLVTEELETLWFDGLDLALTPVAERHHVVLGCRC